MTDASTSSAGRRRFVLKRRIGSGAFGEVFLAELETDSGFRRKVALKVLNEEASRFKEAARRMRDEARILGRLQHRNIVEVLDLVRLEDKWAVVMAYVPGADLEQVLQALVAEEERFPQAAAVEAAGAIARALHAAWTAVNDDGRAMNVVHRDIKPSNARLTPDGELKVLDFGVARIDLDAREAKTKRPGLIGTERYMAPERILLEGDGPEGDVYALAATLVELLLLRPLGRTPVREEPHASFVMAALAEVRARVQGPEATVDELIDTLRRALDADPAARPPAGQLSAAWNRIARDLPGESLTAFCERYVDRVPRVLGLGEGQTVAGTLLEGTSTAEPTMMIPPEGAAGVAAAPSDGLGTLEPAGAVDPRQVQRVVLLALILGLLGAGLGLYALLAGGRSDATVPLADPPITEVRTVEAPAEAEAAPIAPADDGEALPADDDVEAIPADDAEAPEPAAPEAAPVREEPAPKPAPSTRSTARAPAAAPPPTPAPEPVADDADAPPADPAGPPVSRALVVVPDVSAIEVTCGGAVFRGTSSSRLRDFPAGPCTVRVDHPDGRLSTTVTIDRARTVNCAVSGGRLTCS